MEEVDGLKHRFFSDFHLSFVGHAALGEVLAAYVVDSSRMSPRPACFGAALERPVLLSAAELRTHFSPVVHLEGGDLRERIEAAACLSPESPRYHCPGAESPDENGPGCTFPKRACSSKHMAGGWLAPHGQRVNNFHRVFQPRQAGLWFSGEPSVDLGLTLRLRLDAGRAPPPYALELTVLRSYEHVGRFAVDLRSGAFNATSVVDARWDEPISVPRAVAAGVVPDRAALADLAVTFTPLPALLPAGRRRTGIHDATLDSKTGQPKDGDNVVINALSVFSLAGADPVT